MAQEKSKQSVWQRIGTALNDLDTAFDPAASVQDRLATLEARVAALEAEPIRDAEQGRQA